MQYKHASGLWACCFLGCLAGVLTGACSDKSAPSAACDQGSVCRDTDCDNICDITEGADVERDTDGDGIPDYLDTDADNDGLRDRDEAGDEDRATDPVDRDKNGIADYVDPDYPLHFQPPTAEAGIDDPVLDPDRDASPDDAQGDASGPTYSGDPAERALCEVPVAPHSACATGEDGETACDGLDNDCDGRVDNDNLCACTRGAARSCFLGPEGKRNVGACRAGIQRCVGEEFSHWGPCEDSVAPSAERCDGIDNDCDGCTDELRDCTPNLSCPGPNDPRVPEAAPFVPYVLDAARFYSGPDALSYRFSIRGSPCDRLFQNIDPKADSSSGRQSFQIADPTAARTEVVFQLSGSYTIDLVIVTRDGELRCTFVVHVRAPGLRVELCWDKTGPLAQQGGDAVDLDLHLAKQGATQAFATDSDCYWQTCRGATAPWDYPSTTDLSRCTGPAAQNYATYSQLGFCPNPRLDADNRLDRRSRSVYITENINLDVPNAGDLFRIAVLYQANVLSDQDPDDAGASAEIDTRALVNVYCDGDLLGSFGGDPEQQLDPDAVHMSVPGALWRVADVAVSSAGCALSPLRDPVTQRGYWLTNGDSSYGDP